MPSLRSRIVYWILKHGVSKPDRNASLPRRRAALEKAARHLPMPRRIEIEPTKIASMAGEWIRPAGEPAAGVVLYLHGGAYTMGSCVTHRALAARIALAGGARVLLPEFRLAPEHPCPESVEDAMTSYRWLIERGVSPEAMVVAGDSSGGGLAVALMVLARDDGLPLPAAIVCLSPWADLEMTGESITTRARLDPVCSLEESRFHAACYLGGTDPRSSVASPIHADLSGLPPLLIQVGDREILLDDSIRLAESARRAGVDVELQAWDGMWHVWHLLAAYVPEGERAIRQVGSFIRKHLDAG